MTTGEKIRKLRIEAGLLQRELAEIVGVNVTTVNSWETDKRIPLPSTIKKLNDYFGVDIADDGKPKVDESQLAHRSARCRACDYRWGNGYSNDVYCDYYLRTGIRRECPPGDECTKFKPRKGYRTYGKDFKI